MPMGECGVDLSYLGHGKHGKKSLRGKGDVAYFCKTEGRWTFVGSTNVRLWSKMFLAFIVS
jgi:hypothetical protein